MLKVSILSRGLKSAAPLMFQINFLNPIWNFTDEINMINNKKKGKNTNHTLSWEVIGGKTQKSPHLFDAVLHVGVGGLCGGGGAVVVVGQALLQLISLSLYCRLLLLLLLLLLGFGFAPQLPLGLQCCIATTTKT